MTIPLDICLLPVSERPPVESEAATPESAQSLGATPTGGNDADDSPVGPHINRDIKDPHYIAKGTPVKVLGPHGNQRLVVQLPNGLRSQVAIEAVTL